MARRHNPSSAGFLTPSWKLSRERNPWPLQINLQMLNTAMDWSYSLGMIPIYRCSTGGECLGNQLAAPLRTDHLGEVHPALPAR